MLPGTLATLDIPFLFKMLSLTVRIVVVFAAATSGLPASHSRPHIVGGADSTIEDHPYQVAIESEYNTILCGGSILSSKVILTAAHPFYPLTSCERNNCEGENQEENFFVRVGSTYREKGGLLFPFNLKQLTIYPNYPEGINYGDVALIQLSQEIQFSPTAAPVPLITINEEIQDGTTLIVTGYGLSSFDDQIPDKLQVAQMIKRNREDCRNFAITDMMLCVGKGIPTTFHGDSGGPLINGKGELVGIVSWGSEKPTQTDPALFTNIAHPSIHKFIDKHVSSS